MSTSLHREGAARLTPARLAALRVGCRKADGQQVGGAVPRKVADYLEARGLVLRPNAANPWWVLTTASGAELLCAAEAT